MIWSIDDGRDARPEGVDEDGIPDPAYAASLGLVRAPLGRRAVATLVEAAVYALLALPLLIGASARLASLATGAVSWYGFLNHPDFVLTIVMVAVTVVLSLAFTIVQLVLHGRKGVTLGKALTRLRTVNVATLGAPGFGRALLRVVVLWASSLLPIVGPLLFLGSPLLDRDRRRGWLDLVGRTWLVDVAKGLDPYDVKRMRIARKTVAADPVAEQQQLPSLATPAQQGAPVAYQPGARVSAGVLGAARPHAPGAQPVVGLATSQQPQSSAPQPSAPQPASAPAAPYRPGELSGSTPAASAPAAAPGVAASTPVPPTPSSPFARPVGVPSAPDLRQAGTPAQGVPSPEPLAAQATPAAPPIAPAGSEASAAAAAPEQARWTPPRADAAPATAPAGTAPASLHEPVSDATVVRGDDDDLEATRIARPRAIVLELDDGTRIPLVGRTLIGRNPSLQQGEAGTLVPIPDDTRSMSKTHVAIDVEGGTIQVVDRHSTNGTAIVHDGAETRLLGGVPTRAEVGDTVLLGDRRAVISRG